MYSISNIPNGAEIPPVGTLLKGRPTSWQGLPIKWSSSADPVPVYLTSFPKSSEPTTAKVFLFGARYDLAEALLDDESLGKGHFIEYFVMWRRPDGGWNLHRLLQHHSVTFSDGSDDDTKDYVPARTISSPSRLALDRLPDWESEGDAVWPTNHAKPMTFLGQVALPESKLTRDHLSWGMSVYLFWDGPRQHDAFKIVVQPSGVQTADEHYEAEA